LERHFTIHVHAANDHGVLQRVLLVFSRRRLRVRALQFFDLQQARPADMQIDIDCRAEQARDVVAQLRAIVEVSQVWAEEAPATDAVAAALAAA
jgi:acetolactate synthase small subunit